VPPNVRPFQSALAYLTVLLTRNELSVLSLSNGCENSVPPQLPLAERREVVDDRVVLAAEAERTEARFAEPDERLAAEHAAALAEPPVVHVEAVFQREDRLQPAAEILAALQAPAAALRVAARELVIGLAEPVDVHVVGVVEAFVDQAIQRHTVLRKDRRGASGQRGGENDVLLHDESPEPGPGWSSNRRMFGLLFTWPAVRTTRCAAA
jgi:hypothetical protein